MLRTRNDMLSIIKVYRQYTDFHKYCDKVKDRFGFWNDIKIHNLPQYTERRLEEYSVSRAKELGYKNILWSGGVDSTFIICSYIFAKVPFRILYDYRSIRDGYMFYKWCKGQNNIDMLYFNNITEAYQMNNLLHGDVADLLFSPDEKRRTYINNNISFYDNMEYLSNRDMLYQQILEYGKLLNKPTTTNDEIIRLINYGNMYFHGRDELHYIIFPNYRIESFFDTPIFNDISYSQYWNRTVEDDKPEMHRFICEVTQDERMMWGVTRVGTKIPPRIPRIQENYKRWDD